MTDAIRTAHNYHDWVFSSFAEHLLPGTALEVGSGHGRYSRRIAKYVDRLLVSDIDPVAVDAIRSELSDLDNVECMVMNGIDPERVGTGLDNVILVNLLEHIEDDREMLDHCHRVLRPGGVLMLFVPAFQALYSEMDQQAGHFRRYQRRQLVELVESASFRVTMDRFFNSVGFFGWYANKLSKSTVNSSTTNLQVSLYERLIPIIKHADKLLPFVGQSLVVVAHRKAA